MRLLKARINLDKTKVLFLVFFAFFGHSCFAGDSEVSYWEYVIFKNCNKDEAYKKGFFTLFFDTEEGFFLQVII